MFDEPQATVPPPKSPPWMALVVGFLMLVFGATFVSILVSSRGCQRKAMMSDRGGGVEAIAPRTSPYEVAIDFLNRLNEFDPTQARQQVLYNLRQWVREQPGSVEWIADPMFRRLPSEFAESSDADQLAEGQFQPYDAFVLQEAVWLRDVAQSVARRPSVDQDLNAWFEQLVESGALTRDQVNDLAVAARLFDWTVRNLQLDDENEEMDVVDVSSKEKPAEQRLRYILEPWENLRHGHGDWLERSRVFILLARQRAIPVVMLAVDNEDQSRPEPWLPAALINDQLYLFDMKLGLPVFGREGQGIATLAETIANPELLLSLADERGRYRLPAKDLDNLVALIDATPAHLSQRMKLVESRLQGDKKMVVTVAPTPLAVKLRTCQGVNRVDIWTLPYEGYRVRRALQAGGMAPDELVRKLTREQKLFATLTPLVQGRLMQFRGVFDSSDDEPGAKAYLMSARTPDKEIGKFDLDIEELPPDSPLLKKLPQDAAARQRAYQLVMAEGKQLAVMSKQYASYWLGLIAFEAGDYEVAIDYFEKRTLDAQPPSPWAQGARYNLGRAYEAIGRRDGDVASLEKAREIYLSDLESPQAAGNRIRARRLDVVIEGVGSGGRKSQISSTKSQTNSNDEI